MKKGRTKYSPAFKFQVVLEALKAEGKGTDAQVARAYGIHPVNWPSGSESSWSMGRKSSAARDSDG